MEVQLWDLFRETGEPMGYLLYRSAKQQTNVKNDTKKTGTARADSDRPDGGPPASG